MPAFIFPPTRFISNCLHDQLKHMRSEAVEACEAYYEPSIEHVAEELCDVIHSAETALRILADRYEVDVLAMQAAVVEKNRVRGYY